ncbi:MAG: universal stress protein [Bacteroidota bacterium]
MSAAPVLAALDVADDASRALVTAADYAERSGRDLHILNVRASMPTYVAKSDPDAGFRAMVEVKVDQALGPGACAQLQPTIHVVHGDAPAHATISLADEIKPALVVLGTHGRRGYQRFAHGSVAEEVIRQAPRPVLAVPNGAERLAPSPQHPVLIPTDLSTHSAAALRAGTELAARFDAPVIVLHTVPPSGFGAGRYVISGRVQSSVSEATREAVGIHLDKLGIEAAEVLIEPGFPDEVIDRIAEERQVGCIAMGTHGRRGIEYAVVGSITESVLRRAACPVLAVRA